MMEMASKMQASGAMPKMPTGGAMPSSSGASSSGRPEMTPEMMEQASKMMSDPTMMKNMSEMMANMSPETLESMSKQAGFNMSAEQAKKTADMMKNVKPEHMQKIMKVAMYGQAGYTRVRKAYTWAKEHKLLMLALFGLLFAWLTNRWFFAAAPAAVVVPPVAAPSPSASTSAPVAPTD